ncbi:xanthine dehydrogenase accessory protein XdhC [Colwellia sp. MB02u-14]|uniref:xanthine dehydrogenase accessory protein XdhC n=1 Tax=Colwellia sp. MB02u-14 TaxID=2759815 RepID=UPI0015F3EB18|nr:xanthine dehydrogenase accessory protein XdhC [Colwellia sp. MB02u-14]MBA6302769.1 xanthine dehydrogenase accessory protein XdhC [Colwellia sp. MB02u-14]
MDNRQRWSEAISLLKGKGEAFVLLTIIGVHGSAPRNSGTKMVVTANATYDTIGGGHLEFKSIAKAHQLLAIEDKNQHIEHFSLGATLGQCCGGDCTVLFESFAACKTQIMLFGAGHVGKALTTILADLPCQVKWVDNREAQFPPQMLVNPLHNVECVVSDSPVDEIAIMPAGSFFIIMTHNHQLDFELCQALLKRGDFAYTGLIGSETKWKRFQHRLKHREFSEEAIEQLKCPIGLSEVPGKRPMEVAVSIAAEVIGLYQKDDNAIHHSSKAQGISFKALTPLLNSESSLQRAGLKSTNVKSTSQNNNEPILSKSVTEKINE